MKLRIILSVVFLALYGAAMKAFDFFYAPLTGQLAAQQVNDSVVDYSFAKFVRDGHAQGTLFLLLVVALVILWVSWSPKKAGKN